MLFLNRKEKKMKLENALHLLRAAKEITQKLNFLIVGSQAIVADKNYKRLEENDSVCLNTPELDLVVFDKIGNDMVVDEESGDYADWNLGELSRFNETHGYYIQAVDLTTSKLFNGWENRLNKIQQDYADNFFISLEDIVLSKLYANREKDIDYVNDLNRNNMIDFDLINKIIDKEILLIDKNESELDKNIVLKIQNRIRNLQNVQNSPKTIKQRNGL